MRTDDACLTMRMSMVINFLKTTPDLGILHIGDELFCLNSIQIHKLLLR